MPADLELALALADLAARVSLPRFASRAYEVQIKPDGSPVTDVDLEVERLLRARLKDARPDDAILGEEFGLAGEADRRWYVDPIDGTSWFVDGAVRWATLIALQKHGEIVAAVIDQPALGTRWWAARGEGAFNLDGPLTVSRRAPLAVAVVADDQRSPIERMPAGHPLVLVAAAAAGTVSADRDSFLAVAEGTADVAVGMRGFEWDFAPYALILAEAGGRFSDFDGAARIDSGNGVATNGLIHDQVVDLLRASS